MSPRRPSRNEMSKVPTGTVLSIVCRDQAKTRRSTPEGKWAVSRTRVGSGVGNVLCTWEATVARISKTRASVSRFNEYRDSSAVFPLPFTPHQENIPDPRPKIPWMRRCGMSDCVWASKLKIFLDGGANNTCLHVSIIKPFFLYLEAAPPSPFRIRPLSTNYCRRRPLCGTGTIITRYRKPSLNNGLPQWDGPGQGLAEPI